MTSECYEIYLLYSGSLFICLSFVPSFPPLLPPLPCRPPPSPFLLPSLPLFLSLLCWLFALRCGRPGVVLEASQAKVRQPKGPPASKAPYSPVSLSLFLSQNPSRSFHLMIASDWVQEYGHPYSYLNRPGGICNSCEAVGTASGPLSAYDWTESADWTTRPRSNIDWACDNPNLHLPGSARDNFFEDVMHEDALGVRQILCGGDLLFISHYYSGSLLLGKTS